MIQNLLRSSCGRDSAGIYRGAAVFAGLLGPRSAVNPYRRAAIFYFIYGVVYLTGAIVRLTPERQVDINGVPWWVFYLVGALFVVLLPALVWFERKWFTRIIAFGPLGKCVVLARQAFASIQEGNPLNSYDVVFAVVAFVAAWQLFVAGWSRPREQVQAEEEQPPA